MKQKTNGKIIIAILAMFAVASSVIGFTYAYFTARLGANSEDESVRVTAGELVATFNGTNSIVTTNVVPGWLTDNMHYYNADKVGADGKIFGTLLSPTDDVTAFSALQTNPYLDSEEPAVAAYRKMGLTAPLAFTVENTSTNADADDQVNYAIKLQITTNGICTAMSGDCKNVNVALYKGEFKMAGTYANNFGEGNTLLAGKFQLGASGTEQIIVKEPQSLLTGAEQKYFIVFEYLNEEDVEQTTKGANINVTATIVGIQEGLDTDAGKWFDEDNNQINFPKTEDEKSVS